MLIVWLIGFLFTVGILRKSYEPNIKWHKWTIYVLTCSFIWPLLLGALVSGVFNLEFPPEEVE